MLLTAHAKINWSLSVVGKRGDGYHLLDTLMQSIAFGDSIRIEPSDALTFSVSGGVLVPVGAENLALRAAQLLKDACQVRQGALIHLIKKTPTGAGLGGGSADAAAILLGLNELWELSLSGEELLQLAKQLGADVPFCLLGGLCRARGIGDVLEPIELAAPLDLLIVQPCKGLSTPTVFSLYDALEAPPRQPDMDAVERALQAGDIHALSAEMGNQLERAAVPLRPEIAVCAQTMEHYGALRAQMTGSGSAVIGLFDSREALSRAFAQCARLWPRTVKTRTISHGISIIPGA